MRLAGAIASAACLAVFAADSTFAQDVTGTYRLTICSAPCVSTDTASVVARGRLVLFGSAIPLHNSLSLTRIRLRERSGDRPPNACFVVTERQQEVGERELYAGIVRSGLTEWQVEAEEVTVVLYQSPDARYVLQGTIESGDFSGRGIQRNCCGGPPPETYFLAERIGTPDVRACS